MSGGAKPTHRLLLVRDRANAAQGDKGVFLELGPLWPSKNGNGYSGPIRGFPVDLVLVAGGKYRFIISEIERDEEAPPEDADPYAGQFDDPA